MQSEARTHYLTFLAAGEEYGVEVLDVMDILHLSSITRLPARGGTLRCVVKVDGKTVPVLDLGTLLGFPAAPLTERSCLVVIEREWRGGRIGILAEALKQVVELPAKALRPAPALGALSRAGHVAAVAGTDGATVQILDIHALTNHLGADAPAPAESVPAVA